MRTVGIDLIEIDDVRRSIGAFGDRYVKRVFTRDERTTCAGSPVRLAETFAVKEATVKALGYDSDVMSWHAVEVQHSIGATVAHLTGAMAELARRRGVTDVSASCTHDRRHAGAVVIVEAAR